MLQNIEHHILIFCLSRTDVVRATNIRNASSVGLQKYIYPQSLRIIILTKNAKILFINQIKNKEF